MRGFYSRVCRCAVGLCQGFWLGAFFLHQEAVWAEAATPIVMAFWPEGVIFLFVPVVFIEWLVIIFFIRNISRKRALYVTTMANLFSIIFGIFLPERVTPRGFWLLIGGVILETTWPFSYEHARVWVAYATIVSLLPFCLFISYFSEKIIFQKMLGDSVDNNLIKKAVWYANVASCWALLMLVLYFLVKG